MAPNVSAVRVLSHTGLVLTASVVSLLTLLSSAAMITGGESPQRTHYSIQEVRSLLTSNPSQEQIDNLERSLKSQNEWWAILLSQEIESKSGRDLLTVLDSIESAAIAPPTSVQVIPGAGTLFSN